MYITLTLSVDTQSELQLQSELLSITVKELQTNLQIQNGTKTEQTVFFPLYVRLHVGWTIL